jgi:thiol-disulfide isomerase/thioredoxin
MGRLSIVAVLEVLALAGCDDHASSATSRRSDQVIATGAAAPSPSAPPSVTATPRTTTTAHPGKLCQESGNPNGRQLAKMAASHAEAPGAQPLDGVLTRPNGPWTWVNFWAAWCGPCKEEMPRLVDWSRRLTKAGTPMRLVFVSLDDDKRQLDRFLDEQPADGVRASLWLPEGPARASWLKGLRMSETPDLPEQALVDPNGHVRCFIEGAVDEGDYPEIAALVAR